MHITRAAGRRIIQVPSRLADIIETSNENTRTRGTMSQVPSVVGLTVIENLRAAGVAPTPENYTAEYYRVTGETPPGPPTQSASETAPEPQPDTRRFYEEILAIIRAAVQSTLGTTESLTRSLDEHHGALSDSVENFRKSRDRQEILELLGTILHQSNDIRDTVESSRRELVESRRELENIQKELAETRHELNHDALTGVLNRRTLEATLSHDIARVRRTGGHLALAMIDLDHFKTINDVHGHQVGDEALIYFVQMARSVMRQSDALVRFGGDEFIMILPDTDARGGHLVLSRLHMLLGKSPFTREGVAILLSFSAGIAQLTGGEDDKQLLRRADKAAYLAKQAGRNCIRLAE
jgi:diguanylate cyclase